MTPLLRVREQPLRVTRFAADAHLGGLAASCAWWLRHLPRQRHRRRIWWPSPCARAASSDPGPGPPEAPGPDPRLLASAPSIRSSSSAKSSTSWTSPRRPAFQPLPGLQRGAAQRGKAEVIDRLPPRVAERHERFSVCDGCGGDVLGGQPLATHAGVARAECWRARPAGVGCR